MAENDFEEVLILMLIEQKDCAILWRATCTEYEDRGNKKHNAHILKLSKQYF